MSNNKTEALRLADALEFTFAAPSLKEQHEAAAELRRLHAELVESEKWRDRDEWRAANAERERDIAEAQRDALLEALEFCAGTSYATDANDIARAAIKAVEGENHAKNL